MYISTVFTGGRPVNAPAQPGTGRENTDGSRAVMATCSPRVEIACGS
jgi:hypothetical protein